MTPNPNVPAQPLGQQDQQPGPQIPPELTKTPKSCTACDMMVTLGLLTSSCEEIEDPIEKAKCKTMLKPLESGSIDAAEALSDVIVELGEEHLDGVVERMNILLYSATSKAKEKLIAKGVLNTDGTKKE